MTALGRGPVWRRERLDHVALAADEDAAHVRELAESLDWAISLKQGFNRKVWTLWVSAGDGKPLELRDPGDGAAGQTLVIRWDAYEVLPGGDAGGLVTLAGAHPSARVVTDPAQVMAAEQHLTGGKG